MTDLYALTMAQGYWLEGIAERDSVFHLYARKAPYNGKAVIVAGQGTACDFLQDLRISDDDVQWIAQILSADGRPLFRAEFLEWLRGKRFSIDVDAVAEGEILAPPAPMMRVRGPLWQAQWVESALLSIMSFQTLIATCAARLVAAVGPGGEVVDFGMRRAQGLDGGVSAARAAYIGGVSGTSHVYAAHRWGIPPKGTHAHAWVSAIGDEEAAFFAYARALRDPCILLVDTWDTVEGVKKAIKVGLEMRKEGRELAAIRLDSGDLLALSVRARQLLDEAGLVHTKICASNELDEAKIRELRAAAAPIDIWGVGTALATGGSVSSLGGVYKLSALRKEGGDWDHLAKRSDDLQKASWPGELQVWRMLGKDGIATDVITDQILHRDAPTSVVSIAGSPLEMEPDLARPLLRTFISGGKRVIPEQPLERARTRAADRWANYMNPTERLRPGASADLFALRRDLLSRGQE